MRTSEGNGVAN